MTIQAVYFDLDGTLADLYGVQDWEHKLRSSNPTPYKFASPLVDMAYLNDILEQLAACGVVIGVISWLAMNSTKEYDKQVRKEKKQWLAQFMPTVTECHFVKYGTPKHSVCKVKNGAILVDDNAEVRAKWNRGDTIDATHSDRMLRALEELLVDVL